MRRAWIALKTGTWRYDTWILGDKFKEDLEKAAKKHKETD